MVSALVNFDREEIKANKGEDMNEFKFKFKSKVKVNYQSRDGWKNGLEI